VISVTLKSLNSNGCICKMAQKRRSVVRRDIFIHCNLLTLL